MRSLWKYNWKTEDNKCSAKKGRVNRALEVDVTQSKLRHFGMPSGECLSGCSVDIDSLLRCMCEDALALQHIVLNLGQKVDRQRSTTVSGLKQ